VKYTRVTPSELTSCCATQQVTRNPRPISWVVRTTTRAASGSIRSGCRTAHATAPANATLATQKRT
jgi:hypothetical protein